MNLQQKTARGVIWSGIQVWGGRAVSFVVLVVLSRRLDPEAFGLVAMASIFTAFVQIFLDQGFGDSIIQRADLEQGHLDTAFWTNMLTSVFMTFVCVAAAELIANLFQEPQLTTIVRWLSLTFILAGLSSTQQAILRRDLAFKELSIRSLGAAVAGGVVGVSMAYLGYGVWSLVGHSLAKGLIGAVVLWRVSRWRPQFYFSRKCFHDLFSFGFNIVGTNFLNFLNRRADSLLIGYFLGPTILGFYTIAYRLLLTITEMLTGVAMAVAFPAFSRLQNEKERLRHAFYQATRYVSLISFPVFIGLALIAPELTRAIYGEKWAPSIPVMQILAFIGILHSVFYFNSGIMLAVGKPSWRLGFTFVYALANVIIFMITVRYGIVAVAAAYVIRGYLLAPVEIWVVRKLIKIDVNFYLSQFIAPVLACTVMAVVILGFRYILKDNLNLTAQLVIYVSAGVIVYLFAIQLMAPSLRKQLLEIIHLVLPQQKLRES